MEKIIKYISHTLYLAIILYILSGVNVKADEKVMVNITTEDGHAVLSRDNSPIYTALPLVFTVYAKEDEKCFYSLSTDDGSTYGDYVFMEDKTVILYNNKQIVPDGKYIIRFMKESGNTEITSYDYKVCFDDDVPEIEVRNEEILTKWFNTAGVLKLRASDKSGYIGRIVATCNGDTIYEQHYSNKDAVSVSDFEIPLNKCSRQKTGTDVEIQVLDLASNSMVASYTYYYDNNKPLLSLSGPGNMVNDDEVYISIKVDKPFLDTTYLSMQVTHKDKDVESTSELDFNVVADAGMLSQHFDKEGEYCVKAYAYDLAGNQSDIADVSFIIDKTPPSIEIEGASDGVDVKQDVELLVRVIKNMYDDCTVNVYVQRTRESMTVDLPVSSYKLRGPIDERIISLKNDGDYNIKVVAIDKSGRESTKSLAFRIDKTPPIVEIEGIDQGEITNNKPIIRVNAADIFYSSTIVKTELKRKDTSGQYIIIKNDEYNLSNEVEHKDITISDEGDYIVKCVASDRLGNVAEDTIAFSVDYTPPVIASLTNYDKKYFNKITLPNDFNELITDRNKYQYDAYINDESIAAGEEILEEGKYSLWIWAADEAGNESDAGCEFIVDHTAPQIVVSGINSDGTMKRGSIVNIELRDTEDVLDAVKINGVSIPIMGNKRAEYIVGDYGKYDIEILASDAAGNSVDTCINANCDMVISPYIRQITDMNDDEVIEENHEEKSEAKSMIMGVITMLSGTYGLVFRGVRIH